MTGKSMDFSGFGSEKIIRFYLDKITGLLQKNAGEKTFKFMEVCGTHTMAAARSGLKTLLPPRVKLISGPGCPVCVTPNEYVDRAIALGRLSDAIITTFGDMFRVPGTASSLEKEKSAGSDIRIVYSPAESIAIARENPSKKVIFLGVGFETTAPVVAATILAAKKSGITNLLVLSAHKFIPPAMKVIATSREISVDGFMCPGHVSAVIGSKPYGFIARYWQLPCVIAGFEPSDIAEGIYMLLKQAVEKKSEVEIQYDRVVRAEGNPKAVGIMSEVFGPADAAWRGIGTIPLSGMKISEKYAGFDAAEMLPVEIPVSAEPVGCRCGDILKGLIEPPSCPLFSADCTPEHPVGACMVSSEGACAAHFRYLGNG